MAEQSYDDLYERAQELEIEGRSDMDKAELKAAVEKAEGKQPASDPQAEQTASASSQAVIQPPTGTAATPDEGPARELRTDPETRLGPGQGAVPQSTQPDHTPDEDGFVGADPIYRNASTAARRPATGEGDDATVEEGSILKSAEQRAREEEERESDNEDE